MTTLAVTVGVVVWARWGAARGILATLLVLLPLVGVGAAAAAAARRRYRRQPPVEPVDAARLIGIALRAGLSLPLSLAHAAAGLPDPTRSALQDILRRSSGLGLGPALAATRGPLGPLAHRLAGVHRTGASLSQTIDGLDRELTESRHATQLARARRLPVQLTLPLVLLTLPGSVLLLIGPTVVGELQRLTEPFWSVP